MGEQAEEEEEEEEELGEQQPTGGESVCLLSAPPQPRTSRSHPARWGVIIPDSIYLLFAHFGPRLAVERVCVCVCGGVVVKVGVSERRGTSHDF